MLNIIRLLCFAVAIKLCVILAHEDYICIENPECFTLLLKQQEHLNKAVQHQLESQERMLLLQQKQLEALQDLAASTKSSPPIWSTLLTSVLSNFIYILVLGFTISALPWIFRKYTELAKRRKEDQLDRELAADLPQYWSQRSRGSGHAPMERSTGVNQESTPLMDIQMDPIGVVNQMSDSALPSSIYQITDSASAQSVV